MGSVNCSCSCNQKENQDQGDMDLKKEKKDKKTNKISTDSLCINTEDANINNEAGHNPSVDSRFNLSISKLKNIIEMDVDNNTIETLGTRQGSNGLDTGNTVDSNQIVEETQIQVIDVVADNQNRTSIRKKSKKKTKKKSDAVKTKPIQSDILRNTDEINNKNNDSIEEFKKKIGTGNSDFSLDSPVISKKPRLSASPQKISDYLKKSPLKNQISPIKSPKKPESTFSPKKKDFRNFKDLNKKNILFLVYPPGTNKDEIVFPFLEKYGFELISISNLLKTDGAKSKKYVKQITLSMEQHVDVPAEIVVDLILNRIESSSNKKFLISGFPRNEDNSSYWKEIVGTKIKVAALIFISYTRKEYEIELVERQKKYGSRLSHKDAMKKFDYYLKYTNLVFDDFGYSKCIRVSAKLEDSLIGKYLLKHELLSPLLEYEEKV